LWLLFHAHYFSEVPPPWKSPEVPAEKQEELKQQILNLCRSKKNFLEPPPPTANFSFDYEAHTPLILACLKADPTLEKMRFWLVPQ
jgi:hypothetical protein